jgi:purine-binding chemotaxis protein CheW
MTDSIFQRFSETELRTLKARADRAARQTLDKSNVELLTVLSVTVGSEQYALPIDSVSSVYEGIAITNVPCVPPGVSGIANIRGRIVMILDLRTILNAAASPETANVMVMLGGNDTDVALLISGVSGVETVEVASISPTPTVLDAQKAGVIKGIFADGRALLDVQAVINRFANTAF